MMHVIIQFVTICVCLSIGFVIGTMYAANKYLQYVEYLEMLLKNKTEVQNEN